MYCKYEITNIENTGNTVTVYADCFEGDFQASTDIITEKPIQVFMPSGKIGSISAFYDKCPVTEEEYNEKLLSLLEQMKGGREIVKMA